MHNTDMVNFESSVFSGTPNGVRRTLTHRRERSQVNITHFHLAERVPSYTRTHTHAHWAHVCRRVFHFALVSDVRLHLRRLNRLNLKGTPPLPSSLPLAWKRVGTIVPILCKQIGFSYSAGGSSAEYHTRAVRRMCAWSFQWHSRGLIIKGKHI